MAIASTLQKYLADHNIDYEVIPHEPTQTSMRTAETCHISGDCLAKGVVLRDGGGYLLAVLPTSRHLRMADLETQFDRRFAMAAEDEVERLFGDCQRGAVPPVGAAYGIDMIVDDSIEAQPEIYFEGGDHATLIHMSHDQFARLTEKARHGRFSAYD